ncbi:DUF998 domain-containing protein [Tsukamurella ocularis]|uniref:DUF998 domain-containing protein n=1 Tax=Tsukamurella ocularis TaxID=1970234 RepID=UPI00286E829C|nr:DUF998 domain-containing protein [Tsukamurella ocularis]MCS3779509.1 hypothetical protein [Tsukamurella ocularis]MCS3852334.1 hypothetical protein [Tsukamurella ocularis]
MRRARLILLAGCVLYSAWIVAPLLGSQLSPLHSYVSETGSVGQPNAQFFRATDLLAGTAFVVAAALAHRAARPMPKLALVALVGLFVLGAATMCDALMPLSCTPTADAACAAREAAGQVPLTHVGHAVSSGLAGFAGAVAVLGWGLWRRSSGFDGARLPLGMGMAYLLATAWTLAAMLEPALYLGLAQRSQVLTLTLWLVLLATSPQARRPHARPPRAQRPGGQPRGGPDTQRSPRRSAAAAGPSRPDRHDG